MQQSELLESIDIVYTNPTWAEVLRCLKHGQAKGLIGSDGQFYLWDAYKGTHANAGRSLGIEDTDDNAIIIGLNRNDEDYEVLPHSSIESIRNHILRRIRPTDLSIWTSGRRAADNPNLKQSLRGHISHLIVAEARFRPSHLMYHGTRRIFLRSILKHGIQAEPQQRVWDRRTTYREIQARRERVGGSYWTSNFMRTERAATNAIDKFGGTRMIVCAFIQEQAAFADEDRINPQWVWTEWVRKEFGVVSDAWHVIAAYWWGDPQRQSKWIRDFAQLLHDSVGLPNQPQRRELAQQLIQAMLMRGLAHRRERYRLRYSDPLSQIEVPQIPDAQTAEAELLRVKDRLTRYYRKSAIKTDQFNHTLRTIHPVGFSGANRIIAILVRQAPRYYRRDTKDDFKKPFILAYGNEVPNDLIEQYRRRIGRWIGAIKNGHLVSPPDREEATESIREDAHQRGGGLCVMAKSTGRILMGKRSSRVDEPLTWAFFGGIIRPRENPADGAWREFKEETHYEGHRPDLKELYVDHQSDMTYHRYLALIEDEFWPRLNWETDDYRWFIPQEGRWPKPLHPGIKRLLRHFRSAERIRKRSEELRRIDP